MPEGQSKPLLLLDSPASVIRQAMADQPGSALQDLHPGLGAEHPLLIGRQDQRFSRGRKCGWAVMCPSRSRNSTRSSWPAATRRCTEMMRIGQVRLRGVAAMAELANDSAVSPRHRQRRGRPLGVFASARAQPVLP
jgi:hypothetical protein